MGPIKRVNTTMPESLLKKVDLYSQLNLEDRATAIRQLVAEGLRVKLQEMVLDQYRKAKITLRQGAELLGITYLEMNELLRENHIPLARDVTAAFRAKSAKVPPRTQRKTHS
jgi:predicted HTH domain antitoxin